MAQNIQECLLRLENCNRYTAHSKIDDALRRFARDGERHWHPSVVQVSPDVFRAVIRTRSDEVVKALPMATWRPLQLPGAGESSTSLIEIAPKKVSHFTPFRNAGFATDYVRGRLSASGAFASFTLEYLAPSLIEIHKPACPYRVPAAWFRVTGPIHDAQAFERLVLQGVGGSHSFGVGLFNPTSSAIYTAASDTAQVFALTRSGVTFE